MVWRAGLPNGLTRDALNAAYNAHRQRDGLSWCEGDEISHAFVDPNAEMVALGCGEIGSPILELNYDLSARQVVSEQIILRH
ncbi:hypothetical protein [Maricaulis sp.]|uniref:hypothetical protein n=1 Tax=Maricaulis sp. TaxID=1486257 RepID=UPI00260E06FE|nr:hypothetical protein [Maricaulis sp.]